MSAHPTSLRMAYVDPPYLGCCGKFYAHFHNDGGTRPFDGRCWDEPMTHRLLVEWLEEEYPDGWALSASSTNLQTLLPYCPTDVRIGSWVKSFCAFKKGVRPAYAWEPVIFRGGRNPGFGHPHAPPLKGGKQNTPKDFITAPITLKKGLTGAKPPVVCDWIIDLLNAQPDLGDTVDDIFSGTGIFAERWALRVLTDASTEAVA